MATRSLRAAPHAIETWSSCIALVGSESTLAGTASRRFTATIAACVYWDSIRPELRFRFLREEWWQPEGARRVENPIRSALAHRADVGDGNREQVACVAERCTVKVAAGLDSSVREDHGIVDG